MRRVAVILGSAMTVTLGLGGCTSGDTDDGAASAAGAASIALLDKASFENGERVEGAGSASVEPELVITPVNETVIVSPGESNILSIDVDNPEEDADPVKKTQIELQSDIAHFLVDALSKSVGGIDAGVADAGMAAGKQLRIDNAFTVEDDVCADLCNDFISIEVHESSVKESGLVGRRSVRQLVLDCRETGNPDKCVDDDRRVRCAQRFNGDAANCEVELYFCTDGIRRALKCDGEVCSCVERYDDNREVEISVVEDILDPSSECDMLGAASEAEQLQAFEAACNVGAD